MAKIEKLRYRAADFSCHSQFERALLHPAALLGLMMSAAALADALLLLVSFMLDGPMKDLMVMSWPQSVALMPEPELPKLIAQTRVHAGLL